MKVTIHEVAKRAGVGIATVSRALNNDPEVAEATRQRVLAACKDLGYKRSSLARSLKRGRTDNIGVAIMSRHAPVILNPFYAEVIGGIEETLEAEDKHLLLSSLRRNEQLLKLAHERRVDGLIVVGCDIAAEILKHLREIPLPVVLVDNAFDGLPSVTTDHVGGARQATQHLLTQGRRRFSFVSENLENPNFRLRLKSVQETLAEANLPLHESLVAAGGDAWNGGYNAMSAILEQESEVPDAVVAANDPAAMTAIRALKEHGYLVPDDVAITGFDDIHLASHHMPSLTTVRVNKQELGRRGATLLLCLLNSEDVPERTVLETSLIVRDSSGRSVAHAGTKAS